MPFYGRSAISELSETLTVVEPLGPRTLSHVGRNHERPLLPFTSESRGSAFAPHHTQDVLDVERFVGQLVEGLRRQPAEGLREFIAGWIAAGGRRAPVVRCSPLLPWGVHSVGDIAIGSLVVAADVMK